MTNYSICARVYLQGDGNKQTKRGEAMKLTTLQRKALDQYLDGMVSSVELARHMGVSYNTALDAVTRRLGEKQKVRKYINMYRAGRLSI
mgnify:CR=1 FL=1